LHDKLDITRHDKLIYTRHEKLDIAHHDKLVYNHDKNKSLIKVLVKLWQHLPKNLLNLLKF
jgi:hypothetical protein